MTEVYEYAMGLSSSSSLPSFQVGIHCFLEPFEKEQIHVKLQRSKEETLLLFHLSKLSNIVFGVLKGVRLFEGRKHICFGEAKGSPNSLSFERLF